jgi:hypothetical protein
MTPEECEALYDAEIAPALLALAGKCAAAGMSFVAQVAWSPDDSGSTVKLTDAEWPVARLAAYGARSKGNADHLIQMLLRDAEKHGSGSMYVHLLKRKLSPAAHAADIN